MKISLFALGLMLLFSAIFQSCNFRYKRGNGNITVEEFEVEEFNRISIGGNYHVLLIRSDEEKVIIETDENGIPQ